ncbi:hypothetical protein KIH74_22910 [Kineosporia sp. J2-2]|uniref:Uncharacterized protein n=1 Tax=Kineosporia corallincola TaxID=2835133 RepID=A0ABS5TL25_9ACTN|nr:hypothetical protein [Kineosporia corallincola]MBT0771810.1 hypothetical protein [Kineosporia corallincola]
MYPSAPLLLVKETALRFPAARVATEAPANLQEVLSVQPLIRVERSGGPRRHSLDQASIDVDVFALTLVQADDLCSSVCTVWEFDLLGATIDAGVRGAAVVARVVITSGPSRRPVADPNLFRVGATAAVTLHSVGV